MLRSAAHALFAFGPATLLLLAGMLLIAPADAAEPKRDALACRAAIAAAEPGSGIPPGLLLAIALIESGQPDPRTGRVEPWPWAYNTEGDGHAPPNRAAALAEVSALRQSGVQSIDIGCMQINLKYHPQAFASLEQGFEPAANIRYAIRFLRELYARTGNWSDAIAQYHSGEPARGSAYQRRVMLARLGAAWGRPGSVSPPPALVSGLCATGMRPEMVLRGNRPRMICRR
jgi:soluble lytic murein transglycosylase-like protein